MATIPLCFEFFWCLVDVLQSYISRSTISIAVFCWQNLIYVYRDISINVKAVISEFSVKRADF